MSCHVRLDIKMDFATVVYLMYSLFILTIDSTFAIPFSPTTSDYDGYGLKIAANNLWTVEAQNDVTQFDIQFAPFNDNLTQTNQLSCTVNYNNTSQFVYGVTMGRNQLSLYFYFVGEIVNEEDDENAIENRTFIGILNYTGGMPIDCNQFEYRIQYVVTPYVHQEHLVITTDPLGMTVYGFSNLFTFIYTAKTDAIIVNPNNSTLFYPSAVDFDGNYGVLAGFLDNGQDSRIKFLPVIYLFRLAGYATSLAFWTYPSEKTNSKANLYNSKYDISVSLNPAYQQALVGMQSENTVLLLSYANQTLTLLAMQNNGQKSIGYGKGVAWLDNNSSTVAILANEYTMTGYTWISSQIYLYATFTNDSTPIAAYPNVQQPLFYNMSPIFLNIISDPSNFLCILDSSGNVFCILTTPNGYYPSTTGSEDENSPAFSSQTLCIPGTYKETSGIQPCSPCVSGTKNEGNDSSSCLPCANNTFCNLGATTDISLDVLNNVIQATPYPKSPENTIFDDILIENMFSVGSTSHCIAVSPIFWTSMVAILAFIVMLGMVLLKLYIRHPNASVRYETMTHFFKQTDLIGEGEWWIGGLLSFCILVLVTFAYVFSSRYYLLYPIENVAATAESFACDPSLRNSKFETTLQSLAVPAASGELQDMLDMLNNQEFYLNVAFINTAFKCSDEITVAYQLGLKWKSLDITGCDDSSSILSLSVLLPYKAITVRVILPNIYTIGGLRLGLSGAGEESTDLTLEDLAFSQTFSQTAMMLGQTVTVGMKLTKVINQTFPLKDSDPEDFDGLWIGSFTINYYDSFVGETDYMLATATPATETTLKLTLTETDHYILNVEEPIAKQAEIIFHSLLFTIVVLEIFGLIFIICKLILIPLLSFVFVDRCKRRVKIGERRRSISAYGSERRYSHDQYHPSVVGIPTREHVPEIQLVKF